MTAALVPYGEIFQRNLAEEMSRTGQQREAVEVGVHIRTKLEYNKQNASFFKIQQKIADIKKMSRELGIKLCEFESEDWHKAMLTLLDLFYLWENHSHFGDLTEDMFQNIPSLNWMGKILISEGFLEHIDVPDNAWSYKLTFRGLILISLLRTLTNTPADVDTLMKIAQLGSSSPQ